MPWIAWPEVQARSLKNVDYWEVHLVVEDCNGTKGVIALIESLTEQQARTIAQRLNG